jgi:hypothetical protein
MHLETAHPQRLVPRLPQRLIRGYAIQSVQVFDGTAYTGGLTQLVLRGLIAAAIGFCAATRFCAARGRRWRRRRRGFVFISGWHESIS